MLLRHGPASTGDHSLLVSDSEEEHAILLEEKVRTHVISNPVSYMQREVSSVVCTSNPRASHTLSLTVPVLLCS